MQHESNSDTNCKWCTRNNPQKFGNDGRTANQRENIDHPNHSNVAIGLNIEKCPDDLRRLAVTQMPVKSPSANAVVKNAQRVTIIIIIDYLGINNFVIIIRITMFFSVLVLLDKADLSWFDFNLPRTTRYFHLYLWFESNSPKPGIAQYSGAVEYTDCPSALG